MVIVDRYVRKLMMRLRTGNSYNYVKPRVNAEALEIHLINIVI